MNTIKTFAADRWVSWVIEIVFLAVIAGFTCREIQKTADRYLEAAEAIEASVVDETRKTAEMTRALMAKYGDAVSSFASEQSDGLEAAISNAKNFDAMEAAENLIDRAKKGG